MQDKIPLLQDVINRCKKTVFFGGAGVSTESGIPDFRSTDGLYNQKYDVPPEVILSHSYFCDNTGEFFGFYKDRMLCLDAKPNAAHKKLAELERAKKLSCVITQNIDGLHQKAGSERVYELHGSIHRNYCNRCGKFYGVEAVIKADGVPHCECGGVIKPDVVLYEEPLDDKTVEGAVNAIIGADALIIAGTSLTVYPAAGLIRYFRGDHLILINRDETPADSSADIVIRQNVGEVFSKIIA